MGPRTRGELQCSAGSELYYSQKSRQTDYILGWYCASRLCRVKLVRKLAKYIDATVQLKRIVREEAQPVRATTSIKRADPEGPCSFEVRMAPLHERVKQKERERRQALDEQNTLLGQSYAASIAATMSGTSASRTLRAS